MEERNPVVAAAVEGESIAMSLSSPCIFLAKIDRNRATQNKPYSGALY